MAPLVSWRVLFRHLGEERAQARLQPLGCTFLHVLPEELFSTAERWLGGDQCGAGPCGHRLPCSREQWAAERIESAVPKKLLTNDSSAFAFTKTRSQRETANSHGRSRQRMFADAECPRDRSHSLLSPLAWMWRGDLASQGLAQPSVRLRKLLPKPTTSFFPLKA